MSHCQHISPRDQSYFQSFVVARNDIALDVGHAIVLPKDLEKEVSCRKCKNPMLPGELAVVAPRFSLTDFWHPNCFCCTTCDELLVDLAYCVFDDSLQCKYNQLTILALFTSIIYLHSPYKTYSKNEKWPT